MLNGQIIPALSQWEGAILMAVLVGAVYVVRLLRKTVWSARN